MIGKKVVRRWSLSILVRGPEGIRRITVLYYYLHRDPGSVA
jgi:hypothetical protein